MTDTMLQSGQPYTKLDASATAIEFGTVMLSLITRLEAALADVETDKLKLASVIDRVRAQEEATNKLVKK